ncbi:hypothetical protein [Hyphomicrobium sp.]|uniref:hypothetical protein n=1 Tax=Hyphomicrobium sp. TaxID=82 RepID=UPI00132AF24B|nr:hypothetical protein [Hyphomicrobium sp.]KAB2943154.1 MAG: hypothetical protein F9K20_03825 [Hyphomicrobium sp.]MCZ7594155.1 hypothetical protein [Hyphomicrobium sp.]
MTLGDLIGRLTEDGVAEEAIAALGNPSLLSRTTSAGHAAGMSTGAFAARCVHAFANTAGDEAWLALMGRCQGREDPGLAALAYILETTLPRQ